MKRRISTIIAPLVALGCVAAGTGATAAAPPADPSGSSAQADETSPLRLTTPKEVWSYSAGKKRFEFDPTIRLVAEGARFSIWSKRESYADPIVTRWHHGDEVTALPAGTVDKFGGLPRFIRLDLLKNGKVVKTKFQSTCLNAWTTERVRPDAPIRSPFPTQCAISKITLGSVMGIEEGYATLLESATRVKLKPGRYKVRTQITKKYRDLFGISDEDASSTSVVRVAPDEEHPEESHRSARRTTTQAAPQPAAHEPAKRAAGEPAGPQPDLRSIPAFGIRLNKKKTHLQFSATVWNAGNSPMVVDGFRRRNEDVMDAYQYFLDEDGNQVGYQQVGTMEWDPKETHQHWHFRDFARYRLLDADKNAVVRSRKEAFCLTNTDAIDYTVEGADWQPDETDLQTACGEKDSLSIREVLASGSGDTYAQFRAGQSFNVKKLPNGIYYIAVEANPVGRLVESDTANNVAYRKVRIGGTAEARTVKVYPMTAA